MPINDVDDDERTQRHRSALTSAVSPKSKLWRIYFITSAIAVINHCGLLG